MNYEADKHEIFKLIELIKNWINEIVLESKNNNDLDVKLRKIRVDCLNKILEHLSKLKEGFNDSELLEILIDQLRKYEYDVRILKKKCLNLYR